MTAYIAIFVLVFGILAWKRFSLALGALIILFPAYLVRYQLGLVGNYRLPTTLVELAFGIIFFIWVFRYFKKDEIEIVNFLERNRKFSLFLLIFFVASVLGIFISDMWWYSFGQWRAYFFEPILLFFVIIGRRKNIDTGNLMYYAVLSAISVSLFAIFQKITGRGLLPSWENSGRVTSFFTSPNSVGLFLAPVIFLAVGKIQRKFSVKQVLLIFFPILLSLLAILFTKSLGTFAALFTGTLIFIYLSYSKKVAAGLLVLSIFPLIFSPVREFISSKDQSGTNRLQLWSYSAEYLSSSPKNFIFGTGIRQFFRKVQKPHFNEEELERLIYPHNIFLNFWTEVGLIGMMAFMGLYFLLAKKSYTIYKHKKVLGAGLLAMLSVILTHGLIDVPYFKNDLAMMFWVFAGVICNLEEEA